MRTIAELVGDQGFQELSVGEFEKRLLGVCGKHRKEGRALVFAFLIYGTEHANVVAAMRSQVYWQALNDIAGSFLTVFDCNVGARRNAERFEKSLRKIMGQEIRFTPPGILFFQVKNGVIIDGFCVSITDINPEASFGQIRENLDRAARSLARVADSNRDNATEVFLALRAGFQRVWGPLLLNFAKKAISAVGIEKIIGLLMANS